MKSSNKQQLIKKLNSNMNLAQTHNQSWTQTIFWAVESMNLQRGMN